MVEQRGPEVPLFVLFTRTGNDDVERHDQTPSVREIALANGIHHVTWETSMTIRVQAPTAMPAAKS